jgi:hypothetical protein
MPGPPMENVMDRIEKRRPGQVRSHYANEGEISPWDQPLLDTPQGREPGTHNETPSVADEEIADKSVGARPRSDVTAFHDATGEEETADGLDTLSESVRHAAEDLPDGEENPDRIPVFDRAQMPPRI